MLNKPFIDSKGIRGSSFVKPIKKEVSTSKPKYKIRFELFDEKRIRVYFPFNPTKILVTKKNGVKLAHWLLDNCR